MATLLENSARRLARLRKKSMAALADALSSTWHPQDIIEFERFAEAEQLAVHQVSAIENLESGRAWQT